MEIVLIKVSSLNKNHEALRSTQVSIAPHGNPGEKQTPRQCTSDYCNRSPSCKSVK